MKSNTYNNMKRISLLFIISLFIKAAFGVETDETVSVMLGDSVTLHSGLTKILKLDVINWRFSDKDLIAQINKEANLMSLYNGSDGRFRDRLKINDQTGSLTITNITSEHTGLYQVMIIRETTTTKTFSLRVFNETGVVEMSLMERDSVTLHTDLTEIQNYDVIRWRFHDSPLAELNRKTGNFSTHDDVLDGRFRSRLELAVQTGSLTIRNMRTEFSGLYEVNIDSNSGKHTVLKTYKVTVSGKEKIVSGIKKMSVILNTDTEIQTHDLIKWMFVSDDTLIAEIYQPNNIFKTYDGADERFKDRLNLNNQTGSLTITNIRYEDSGVYELKISSRRRTIHRRFTVNVTFLTERVLVIVSTSGICAVVVLLVLSVPVVFYYHHRFPKAIKQRAREGDSVCLKSDVTEVKKDDVIVWRFVPQNTVIAEIKRGKEKIYDGHDERFKYKLMLNYQMFKWTGSLTISPVTTDHSGLYELKSIRDGKTSYKRFRLTVTEKRVDSEEIY